MIIHQILVLCAFSDSVATVWFGNEGHLEFDLNDFSNKEGILDAIGNMRHIGGKIDHKSELTLL